MSVDNCTPSSLAGGAEAPRVLQVIGTSWAMPMHCLPTATAAVAQGWHATIASPSGPEVAALAGTGVEHVPLPISRRMATLSHFRTLWRLFAILRQGNYDLVHVHGVIPGALVRVAGAATSVPVVYHCRGSFFPEPGGGLQLHHILFLLAEKVLARATAAVLALNPDDVADFERHTAIPSARVRLLPCGGCGIDLDAWSGGRFGERERLAAAGEFGLPEGARVVGFVGRIIGEKGVLELIDAFRRVRSEVPEAHLLIVGGTLASERDQRTHTEVLRRIDERGLADAVTMTGNLADPARAVLMMEVLVLPSYREGFGQVIAEAAAMGVPSVAAETRGTRAAIVHGTSGLLVPPRDVDQLATAIGSILTDAGLRRRLSRGAVTRARHRFARQHVVDAILKTYRDVLAHPSEDDPCVS